MHTQLVIRLVLTFLLASAVTTAVPAQQHHNNERGVEGGPLYKGDGLDTINLFNGNLTVNVPLGPTYRAGGEVTYELNLSYNSTLWDFDSQYWSPHQTYYITADPIPASKYNAGFGWNLSLGRVDAPYPAPSYDGYYPIYIAPDGSEHTFYHLMHKGGPRATNVWYTTDGSYLRMKVINGKREIEFPDGTVHRFAGAGWKLDQIRDRFGNYLNVTDSGTYWTLADKTGRTHRVNFRTSAPGFGQVASIVLAGFNGTTATWTFSYVDTAVPRHPRDLYPGNSDTVTLPLLSRITQPGGSTYEVSHYVTGAGGWSGLLKRLTLPTLGAWEWTWTKWEFNQNPGNIQEFEMIAENDGVKTKKLLAANGSQVGQPWTYTQAVSFNDPTNQISEQTTTVTSPEGNDTVYYFNLWPTDWDYGLPYTRRLRDATNKRYLSHESYLGLKGGGTKKRSLYVRYTGDEPTGNTFQFGSKRDFNRRLVSQRTVFHDDGGRYADEDYRDFDGLGHFRWTTTGGNFNSGNVRQSGTHYNPTRGVYDYDQETKALTANHTFTGSPGISEKWIFDTYAWKRNVEAGSTQQVTTCFNADGQLVRERRLRLTGASGGSESSTDVLTVLTYTGGNPIREEWFGGDTQTLTANGTTCTMGLPASQYRIEHTWNHGTLATSQYKTATGSATGNLAFKTVDRDIDLNTGLVKVSRDSGGAATTFEYDGLGRRTWAMPASGDGSWMETVYTEANPGTGAAASTLTRYRSNGSKTASVLDQSSTVFDLLGRISQVQELMPGGAWGNRQTTYNNSGWVISESQVQAGTPTKKTVYSNFDPFGRPGTITPPEGSVHAVTLWYAGVRSVTRNVKIGTSRNLTTGNIDKSTAATTEIYDRQGRLWRVTESSGAGGANVTTEYGWPVHGKLGSVKITAAEGIQNRTYTYDHRGFLLSESLPEATLTYSNYDSRGHVGRLRDGVNDLTYLYDRAERMTLIRDTNGTQRPWKSFTYGTGLTATDRSAGKVKSATRHNYPVLGGVEHTTPMTYTYTYGGRGGAVSRRNLSMTYDGSPSTSFTQTFTWYHLGEPASLGYPQCTFSPCNGGASQARTVSYTYANGLVTAVPGYATSLTYHSNAQPNKISHANGVAETWALDANAYGRPASISTTGANVNWSSGAYAYDGAGHVIKTGTAWYLYDLVGRLVTGTVFDGPTGGGVQKQQSYSFDSFGNVKSISGSPGRSVPVNSLTNRLSGVGVAYDPAGQLIAWNGATYEYDAFGRMKRMKNGGEDWLYMYDPDERRAWQFKVGSPRFDRWALYDLNGGLLRLYEVTNYVWGAGTDYVRQGDRILASVLPGGAKRHHHVDHLGTPRLITDGTAKKVAYHAYLPFGEEVTAVNQDTERLKFTGHERDLANPTSAADDLDYMHARFYNPQIGRFLTLDPAGDHDPRIPQSWNRYAYVRGNPMLHVDPDGQVVDTVLDIGFVGYGVFDIGRSLWKGEGVSKTQYLALGADVAGVFIPFGTGGGAAIRLAAKADNPRIVHLAKKLDRIFTKHLDADHARAAAREKLGEVVARKADGTPFDHLKEFRDARTGVVNAIEELKGMVSDPRLSSAEREAAQHLLSSASKKLDELEALHQRTIDEFLHRRDTKYTVLE